MKNPIYPRGGGDFFGKKGKRGRVLRGGGGGGGGPYCGNHSHIKP